MIPVGPKLAIPETYEGFFEILSEDGRSVRCMETVGEVARRFPDSVLVRENIKAFVSKSDDIETIQVIVDPPSLQLTVVTMCVAGQVPADLCGGGADPGGRGAGSEGQAADPLPSLLRPGRGECLLAI